MFPVNKKLCVHPTTGESQYEAFQAIIAAIMSAKIRGKKEVATPTSITPYELLCNKYGITLIASTDMPRNIVTRRSGKEPSKVLPPSIYYAGKDITHYRAYVEGSVADPYDYFQARNTQGFCQMFAFFLAIGDTKDFVVVDQSTQITPEEFQKLAYNTWMCGRKTLDMLLTNPDVLKLFTIDYNNYIRDDPHYGVVKRASAEQFLDDLGKLDLSDVYFYIYDQPLVGWKGQEKSELLDWMYTSSQSKKKSTPTKKPRSRVQLL